MKLASGERSGRQHFFNERWGSRKGTVRFYTLLQTEVERKGRVEGVENERRKDCFLPSRGSSSTGETQTHPVQGKNIT